ncbi:MAG: MFS transporter [Burkholderiaceae bacterium]
MPAGSSGPVWAASCWRPPGSRAYSCSRSFSICSPRWRWRLRLGRTIPARDSLSLGRTVRAGFAAARASRRLLGALWLTVHFNLFGWPVLSLVPVIARDRLGLGVEATGILASMDGMGALVGAIVLAPFARPGRYGRIYVGGIVLFMCMMPLAALATHPVLAGGALALVGAGQSAFAVMQATICYLAAPAKLRAQALGMLSMCIGFGPIGFVVVGALAGRIGATPTAVLAGISGLAVLALTRRWWSQTWRDAD